MAVVVTAQFCPQTRTTLTIKKIASKKPFKDLDHGVELGNAA
jgi:hypothetical protein